MIKINNFFIRKNEGETKMTKHNKREIKQNKFNYDKESSIQNIITKYLYNFITQNKIYNNI